jgi:ribosome-binding factor A
MSDIRIRRVAELLKHEISRILSAEINDPRIHDVVITRVKVSKDLGIAWVYYSSYVQDSLTGIEIALGKSGGFVRKKLLESVHMKKLPKLIFERDTVQDEASRLDELFKQI